MISKVSAVFNTWKNKWSGADRAKELLSQIVTHNKDLGYISGLTCYCGRQLEVMQTYAKCNPNKDVVLLVESQKCKCGHTVTKYSIENGG